MSDSPAFSPEPVHDVTAVATLNSEGARRALGASVARAREVGVSVCVAAVDRSGQLLAFLRMDGAPALSIGLAQDKAYSVTAFEGLPTHEWYPMIADDPAVLAGIAKTDRLVIFGGGVPIRVGGGLVGAVGVSGGTADQDRAIAEAGAAAIADS